MKFGAPPYYVKLELKFPQNSGGTTTFATENVVVVELAPIELMPYSVLMFLTQVSLELWDGCRYDTLLTVMALATAS
jgi:hypothetical protein